MKTKIDRLDHYARGISYINNKIVFIENSLPEEEVEIEIIKDSKKHIDAKVINYLNQSKDRIKPECPYYGKCGGCNISHISYENQLKFKEENFINILKRETNLELKPVVIKSPKEKYYRNKISLKIKNHKWGYFGSNTHDFIEIDNCLIAKESINSIINNQHLFDISEGEIIIKSNYNDEILIDIKSNFDVNININEIKNISKLVGITINNKIIYGEDSFIEIINNYSFKVSVNSFFQINLEVLSKVFEIISKNNYNNIIDLYCGVGTLGIPINKNKLYGIETSNSSVKDAITNAKINNQNNNIYILGDSSKISEIKDKIDMIIIDPPRSGINKQTMNHLLKSNINEIIYMSCNPQTLAKNLNLLKEKYIIKESYILDMFPQTYHIESITILTIKQ